MFREGNSLSARVRNSKRPNHQIEWKLTILEYSLLQEIKDSSNMFFRFEYQPK